MALGTAPPVSSAPPVTMDSGRSNAGTLIGMLPDGAFADSVVGTDDLWSSEFPFVGTVGPRSGVPAGVVTCSAEHRGRLVVGGRIGYIDGVPVNNLALWDGEHWQSGPSLDGTGPPLCLLSWGDTLLMGRSTKYTEGDSSIVDLWDGTKRVPIGTALRGRVTAVAHSLVRFNGDVIAAGRFQYAQDERAPSVARWDGLRWHAMGQDSLYNREDGSVHRLAVLDGVLFACGTMQFAANDSVVRVAAWDGARWVPLPDQPDEAVVAMTVYQNELVIAGGFRHVGGTEARGLAAWNGEAWRELGAATLRGREALVTALCAAGDSLVAAGWFDAIGGDPAPQV